MNEYSPSGIEVALGNLLSFNDGKLLPDRSRSGSGFSVYGSIHHLAFKDRVEHHQQREAKDG